VFVDSNLILTGSEDTTMKLLSISDTTDAFKVHQILRGQASSIRCTTVSQDPGEDSSKALLFSGGGEFCLVAWHLSTTQRKCVLVKKYIKRKNADCRVMCVSAFALRRAENSEFSLRIVLIGLSNASIEILGYHPVRREFTLLGTLDGHNGPLLSLQHIQTSSETADLHYLLSASTDSRILAWNLSPYVEFYQNEENKREDFNYEQPQESSPLLEIKETHQSGINSFSCRGIHELDNKEANEKFLIASGGDDQALSCVLLEFSKDTPSVKLISKTTFPCAHRASITCIKIHNDLLFSVGPDQRISVWNLLIDERSESIQIQHRESYFSAVADTSCLDLRCQPDGSVQVIVGGMGVQCLLYHSNS